VQTYKAHLQHLLSEHGWEVVEVIDSDDWWAHEFWRIQSRRNLWGYELVLTFLIDPQWDAPRNKGQGIWAIAASDAIPPDRATAEQGIAELCMVKGHFNEKLVAFVDSLDAYRNDLERATHGQA
jgi:hypothetical protein